MDYKRFANLLRIWTRSMHMKNPSANTKKALLITENELNSITFFNIKVSVPEAQAMLKAIIDTEKDRYVLLETFLHKLINACPPKKYALRGELDLIRRAMSNLTRDQDFPWVLFTKEDVEKFKKGE